MGPTWRVLAAVAATGLKKLRDIYHSMQIHPFYTAIITFPLDSGVCTVCFSLVYMSQGAVMNS